MAKIVEELVIIKVSKLVKDSDADEKLLDSKTINSIEQVVQELVGDGIVVELVEE
jgi:hypothetical protein